MNIQIVKLAPIRIAMIRHFGPYEQMAPTFESLFDWVARQGLAEGRAIGLYWDDPAQVPAAQLRAAAAAEIPMAFVRKGREDDAIELGMIEGGEYAYTQYVGPYTEMEPVWAAFTKTVQYEFERDVADLPGLEIYINDPANTPPEALITDLYLPLA